MTPSDDEILDAMITYGGSFASMLGRAWRLADHHNQAKLQSAFPDLWEKYRELASMQAARGSDR